MGPGLGINEPHRQPPAVCSWGWMFPIMSATSVYVPRWTAVSQLPIFPGISPKPEVRSGPGFYQNTTFALCPTVHEILCVPFKTDVSIFTSPLVVLQLSLTGLQRQMLCRFIFRVPDFQTGDPDVGSELSLLWENLCSIILHFVGHSPSWYRIWLYSWVLPSYLSSCGSFPRLYWQKIFSVSFQSFSSVVVLRIVVILLNL